MNRFRNRSILSILNILRFLDFLGFLFLFFVGFEAVLVDGLGELGGEDFLGDVEEVGALGYVLGTLDEVGHEGDGGHGVLDELGLADGVVLDAVKEDAGLENDEVVLVGGQVFLEGRGAVFLGVAVGVLAVGKEDAADVHALGEEEVDGTEGGLDTGGIAITEHGDVGGVAFNEAYLLGGERGAAGGHGILDTRLVHGDDVDVALDEVALVGLGDGGAGLEEAVEDTALVVDFGVGELTYLAACFSELRTRPEKPRTRPAGL